MTRIFTVRNKVAKVMFLQACVCPQEGGCLSACWDTTPPPKQTPPRSRHPPPLEQTPPGSRHPPTRETATAADGTHPTGMHSCSNTLYFETLINDRWLYNWSVTEWNNKHKISYKSACNFVQNENIWNCSTINLLSSLWVCKYGPQQRLQEYIRNTLHNIKPFKMLQL